MIVFPGTACRIWNALAADGFKCTKKSEHSTSTSAKTSAKSSIRKKRLFSKQRERQGKVRASLARAKWK